MKTSRLTITLWVLLTLGLAFWLRASHINYGLPLLLYEDEPIYLTRALNFGFGDFDPHYFKKPSFFLYLHFAAQWLWIHISQWAQYTQSSWQQVVDNFYQNPTTLALLGRSISIAFAMMSVCLVGMLAARLLPLAIAALILLVMAIDPTHVQISPIVISDIPALCFILLGAWQALNIIDHGRARDYFLCALCLGLAISFKYNVFSVAMLVAAHGVRVYSIEKRPILAVLNRRLIGALIIIPLVFLILNPYAIINWQQFMADMNLERRHMTLRDINDPNQSFQPMVGFQKLFFRVLPKTVGWPLYVLGWLGLASLALRWKGDRERVLRMLAIWAFPMVFMLVLCQFRIVNAKYILPIVPFWYLAAGYGLSWLFSGPLSSRPKRMVAYGTLIVMTSLALWPHAKAIIKTHTQKLQPNTRLVAYTAANQTLSPGEWAHILPDTVYPYYLEMPSGGVWLQAPLPGFLPKKLPVVLHPAHQKPDCLVGSAEVTMTSAKAFKHTMTIKPRRHAKGPELFLYCQKPVQK